VDTHPEGTEDNAKIEEDDEADEDLDNILRKNGGEEKP
jgi:hypothetical protein